MKRLLPALIITLFAVLLPSLALSQQYTITDLGTLGGTYSLAYGINNAGQVVGESDLSGDIIVHAFRTAPNHTINPATDDLGTLGGSFSVGRRINNAGQTVGDSFIVAGPSRGFLTAPSGAIDDGANLGTLGGCCSHGYAVNQLGQAVGESYIVMGDYVRYHGFRTLPNQPINPATDDLGTLGGNGSTAFGINASGQVVGGSATTGNAAAHAFCTGANRPINPATDDLGTLGGTSSLAYDINNFGQTVGYAALPDGTYHAFMTSPNRPINPATDDLGTLGGPSSRAYAVNNSGQVVGYAYTLGYMQEAFLYSGGVMYDLNNLLPPNAGWWLTYANGINDAGQIVGSGSYQGQGIHAYLATPTPPTSVSFLQADVDRFGPPNGPLNSGQVNSLDKKLQVALNAINDLKLPLACNSLQAFTNQVISLTTEGVFNGEQGGLLSYRAQFTESLLNCSL